MSHKLLTPTSDEALNRYLHFKLWFYGGILAVVGQMSRVLGSTEDVFRQFPFIADYWSEATSFGLADVPAETAFETWRTLITSWEERTDQHLPIREIAEAGQLDDESIAMLIVAGLPDEDPRFGHAFASMMSSTWPRRLTVGLLAVWWRSSAGVPARRPLRHLVDIGLLEYLLNDGPRSEWPVQVPMVLWEALRGERPERVADWAHHGDRESLLPIEDVVLPSDVRGIISRIPHLFATGEVRTVVVRGPEHNGRRTVLRSIARLLGVGALELDGDRLADRKQLATSNALATALRDLPIYVIGADSTDRVEVAARDGLCLPMGVAAPVHRGLGGPGLDRPMFIDMPVPSYELRQQMWKRAGQAMSEAESQVLAERFRLTTGNLCRLSEAAKVQVRLAGEHEMRVEHVSAAGRDLNRRALEGLAVHIEPEGTWDHLIAGQLVLDELKALESRCRNREKLSAFVGRAVTGRVNPGVRALFSGPSGTGKTLAAQILASRLSLDLYRLDLSAVVNKYIGETEKNIERLFSRAETLDVVLLIDEGDALLGRRTHVQSANDRFANLETNYLLQRLESYAGIVVVTTNAGELIDEAFERRIDVLVEFRRPEARERLKIWQLHLPETHAVSETTLAEVSDRCALSGGQIRNIVLHTALVAVESDGVVNDAVLRAAVQREYVRMGTACPLRAYHR